MNLFKAIVQDKKTLSDRLFMEVSDIDIYCELTGLDLEIGVPISSPLREGDDRPSFSLFIPKNINDPRPEELWWRDFIGDSGDVFKFTKLFALENYNTDLATRKDVIEFLDGELDLGIFGGEKVNRSRRVVDYESAKESKEILFQSRDYTRMDKFWWIQYGVDEILLKEHDVRSVKHLLREDYSIKYTTGAYDLVFAYVVYDKVKIYSPYSELYKWRNTCPSDYIMGEEQRTGKDVLIITKSMKDLLVFKTFVDCDSIAPQSETNDFDPKYLELLDKQYKYKYVVMDYDPAGIECANKLEKVGFEVRWVSKDQITVNDKIKVRDKDMSDYTKNNGIEAGLTKTKEMFNELPSKYFRDDRIPKLLEIKAEFTI